MKLGSSHLGNTARFKIKGKPDYTRNGRSSAMTITGTSSKEKQYDATAVSENSDYGVQITPDHHMTKGY